jgi:hypothetical protein
MRVLNQEHQSLALEQLQQLCDEYPNDQMLGEEIRRITEYNAWLKKELRQAAALVNNPKGLRATSVSDKFKDSFPTSI